MRLTRIFGALGHANTPAATFAFSSNEAGTFECNLDNNGFAACASPIGYAALTDGGHTFAVRAIDQAGNVDPNPASFNWVIDTIAPDTVISNAPITPSTSDEAAFGFTSDESGVTFECRLDGAAFASCANGDAVTSFGTEVLVRNQRELFILLGSNRLQAYGWPNSKLRSPWAIISDALRLLGQPDARNEPDELRRAIRKFARGTLAYDAFNFGLLPPALRPPERKALPPAKRQKLVATMLASCVSVKWRLVPDSTPPTHLAVPAWTGADDSE